ncbi:MAG: hypothetical protein IIC91_02915 [Chloroflexi bacterium]|nr:hypothetical protein [Chloroflexota bacterium]
MPLTKPFDLAVAARLDEYWAWFTPWHRRLWNVGTVAAIREILEASESLFPKALKSVQAEVLSLVRSDQAVGDDAARDSLKRLLLGKIVYRRFAWHQLNGLLANIDADYLKRWSGLMRTGKTPGAELIARSVAGHLLQGGFSPTYLHRWLRYQVMHGTTSISMADVVEEADGLTKLPLKTYRVVIPVVSAPDIGKMPSADWFTATQILSLIASIQGSKPELRLNGGFVLSVRAKDPFVAVEQARELIDRWDARAELATRDRIIRTEKAWVEGYAEPIDFVPLKREVKIGVLSRQGMIYAHWDDEEAKRIDDALQLVQPMEGGLRSAAISGGWAAIESLLTEDGEPEHLAADRCRQ